MDGPKDNLPKRLIGRYISFLLKTTQSKVTSGPFVNVKKTLLSKILAVSVHESKRVSCCTQLLLQALVSMLTSVMSGRLITSDSCLNMFDVSYF